MTHAGSTCPDSTRHQMRVQALLGAEQQGLEYHMAVGMCQRLGRLSAHGAGRVATHGGSGNAVSTHPLRRAVAPLRLPGGWHQGLEPRVAKVAGNASAVLTHRLMRAGAPLQVEAGLCQGLGLHVARAPVSASTVSTHHPRRMVAPLRLPGGWDQGL